MLFQTLLTLLREMQTVLNSAALRISASPYGYVTPSGCTCRTSVTPVSKNFVPVCLRLLLLRRCALPLQMLELIMQFGGRDLCLGRCTTLPTPTRDLLPDLAPREFMGEAFRLGRNVVLLPRTLGSDQAPRVPIASALPLRPISTF